MANGQPTTTWFEWGEGGSFTNISPPVAIGSGFAVVRRTATASNLFGGRIYQYRIGASNVAGIAYGQTRPFATSTRLRVWGLNDYGETNLPPNLANVTAADGGFNFTAAVTEGGKVSAWGDNYWGQTNVPAGLSNVVAISAADSHVLALKIDCKVIAWGDNQYGATNVPPGLSNVVAISAKGNHSLALKADGTMVAWGRNEWGQCNVPPGLSNIVAIACGRYHTVACTAEGKVFTWGRNLEGQLTMPDNLNHLMDIASGDYHGLGLNPDTTLIGWGYNEFGATNIPIGLSNVVGFDGGDFHSLALGTDGTVIAWGYNNYGESTIPPGLSNVVSIIGGFNNSLALVADIGPQAFPVNASGVAGQDLIVPLSGSDPQGDPLSFRITVLPAQASLYQYANGTRGSAILSPNTPVSDPVGRVIFVGGPNESLATFSYVANDGLLDSPPALVTIRARIPGAPFVATEPTTRLATNSVLLNGMVTPNGLATTAWFEWGTNSGFGQTTPARSLGAGLGVLPVDFVVGPFTPDKIVHYRLVASNSAGIKFGGEQTATGGGKLTIWGNNGGGQTNVPGGLGRIVQAGGGTWHSLALRTDGVVVGWGGSTFAANPLPNGISNLVAIAAGSDHGLGLRADGTVTAWGYNGYGQTNVPAGLGNVVAIAGGGNHSVALKADGSLVAWGWNHVGQSTVPFDLTNVVAISAGYYHNVALRDDGTVVSWGNNGDGQTNVPPGLTNVIGVAAGAYHSLALMQNGTVIGWGRNSKGQISSPPAATNVIAIRAGNEQSVALRRDGTVVFWGDNTDNQATIPASADNVAVLASGSGHILAITPNHIPTVSPETVSALAGYDVVLGLIGSDLDPDILTFIVKTLPTRGALYQFAAGGARGPVISLPDTAVTDSAGRLIFAPVPAEIGNPYASFDFAAQDGIASSSNATVTISIFGPISAYTRPATEISSHGAKLNGFVMPTGFAASGWFEWGDTTFYGNSTPATSAGSGLGLSDISAQISGLVHGQLVHFRMVGGNASQIVYGRDQQFVAGGRVSAWGDNSFGQTSLPANPSAIVATAGGLSHSLALRTDGSLVAWGNNTYGQTNIPSGIGKAAAVAAGGFHNLALLTNGTVVAWGRNNLGQTTVPTAATNVIAVAAGGQHSLALRRDGSIVAWGDNSQGQRNVPASLTNVICIAAGWYHNVALRSDGTVTAWGNNSYGQSAVPNTVSNVVWVGAGLYHSLALRGDGLGLVAWGQNTSGQTNIPFATNYLVAAAAGGSHNLELFVNGLVSGSGDNAYGQATPPAGLSNVVTVAGGGTHSLALLTTTNHPPVALAQTSTGYVNHDLTIRLSATDDDLDPLTLKISSLPSQGALYQYVGGVRGPLINTPNTLITDSGGRAFFAPVTNQTGLPYSSAQFTASDGTLDSTPATVTLNIILPPAPQLNAASSGFTNNGSFGLNFTGAPSATYSVWTSTNLAQWQLLGSAENLGSGLFRFLDTAATNSPRRFYRAGAP